MLRPVTKEERLKARWIPENMTVYREIHGAIVYATIDKLHAIAYRGSAMNAEFNYRFRSPAQLDEECERLFDRVKSHNEWKEEKKKIVKSGESDTQKVKKALLKAGYPVTSVTRGTGTSHHWIEIKIDDYQNKIDEYGYRVSQYGAVLAIAQEASGRSHLHDDIQSDLFQVNISVNFSKWHTCADCVVFDSCKTYHTKETGSCGGYTTREMMDKQKIRMDLIMEKERIEKESKEAFMQTPAYFKIKQEEEDLKRAQIYARECEITREGLGFPYVYDGQGNRNNHTGPFPSDPVKLPHEVKEITIDMDGGKKYFDSFKSASSYIRSQSEDYPKTGGYDKLDFVIVFVDGEEYKGRLDVKHPSQPNNDLDLFKHVLEFNEHCAADTSGRSNPQDHQNFINKYLLPVSQEIRIISDNQVLVI